MNNNNHHFIEIQMNIKTWNLLDKKDRNEQDDEIGNNEVPSCEKAK